MTHLKCIRCGQFWTIHTLWPKQFRSITKFCPSCLPVIYPIWKDPHADLVAPR